MIARFIPTAWPRRITAQSVDSNNHCLPIAESQLAGA
jgi:hypothetical protein